MKYKPTWDLKSIPEPKLISEYQSRLAKRPRKPGGGRKPGCDCGDCRTCRGRVAQARRRAENKSKSPLDIIS